MIKKKNVSRGKLVSKLDSIFSQYIRRRKAVDNIVECWTCGKVDFYKKMQNGHFQSRTHYATRWNEINCQVQCVGCNMFKSGQQYIFGKNLDSKYGDGTAHELYMKAKMITKITTPEIKEMIEKYTALVKEFD